MRGREVKAIYWKCIAFHISQTVVFEKVIVVKGAVGKTASLKGAGAFCYGQGRKAI